MERRLFNIFVALSLLVFLGSIAMWARSYWRWDSVAYRGAEHLYTLDSGSGHVGVMAAHLVRDTPYDRGWSVYSDPAHEVGYSGRSLSTWLAVGWDSDRGTFLGM